MSEGLVEEWLAIPSMRSIVNTIQVILARQLGVVVARHDVHGSRADLSVSGLSRELSADIESAGHSPFVHIAFIIQESRSSWLHGRTVRFIVWPCRTALIAQRPVANDVRSLGGRHSKTPCWVTPHASAPCGAGKSAPAWVRGRAEPLLPAPDTLTHCRAGVLFLNVRTSKYH